MLRYTRFVWISLYAQLFCITTASFSEAAALHHHERETSSMTEGLIRSPDNGITASKNVNGWCRRCLRIQDDEASPPVAEDAPPSVPGPVPPPPPLAAVVDLPALPTDPDSPPSPRTIPSSLVTPSGPSVPGLGDNGTTMKSSSALAGKVGFSAGVGLTAGVGLGVLLLGVLYYFKPDLFFLCCKTCVRVQVFHHSAPANANSKK